MTTPISGAWKWQYREMVSDVTREHETGEWIEELIADACTEG